MRVRVRVCSCGFAVLVHVHAPSYVIKATIVAIALVHVPTIIIAFVYVRPISV